MFQTRSYSTHPGGPKWGHNSGPDSAYLVYAMAPLPGPNKNLPGALYVDKSLDTTPGMAIVVVD